METSRQTINVPSLSNVLHDIAATGSTTVKSAMTTSTSIRKECVALLSSDSNSELISMIKQVKEEVNDIDVDSTNGMTVKNFFSLRWSPKRRIKALVKEIGSKGDGVARIKNFVVFIPGAKKGEKARIKIKSVRERFAIGEKVEGKDEE